MAALALMRPSKEFRVETNGCGWPVGHAVKNESGPCGTTVTFNEYAIAVDGIPQPLPGIAKARTSAASMLGPPKGPFGRRVSAMRQGLTGTNRAPDTTGA